MFSGSDGYERFIGRWSRRLAPQLMAFAGVTEGDRVLDVGSGTGALAATAAAVWDYGDDMQMLRTFWDAAVALEPDGAPRGVVT
jgi:cyclopropane fatty-acyl-phospholipid synthase-like methyltransferase